MTTRCLKYFIEAKFKFRKP